MDKIHEDKKNIFIAVQKVLDENTEIWNNQSSLVMAKVALDGKLMELSNLKLINDRDTDDKTSDKVEIRDKLIETTIDISSSILDYASKTGNNDLYEKVNYTKSDLELSRDTILKDMCQLICKKANENIENLINFNVNKKELFAYEILIEEFDKLITDPLELVRKKQEGRKSESVLINEIEDLLKERIDNLVSIFKSSHPQFYETYLLARITDESESDSDKDSKDNKESEID